MEKFILSCRAQHESGITLMETIIALAISMILAASLIRPGINKNKRELYNACLQLQSEIRFAQKAALLGATVCRIHILEDYCQVVLSGSSYMEVEKKNFPDGITAQHDLSRTYIEFTPRGTVSGAITVTMKSPSGYQQKVTVLPVTGRVSIAEATQQ